MSAICVVNKKKYIDEKCLTNFVRPLIFSVIWFNCLLNIASIKMTLFYFRVLYFGTTEVVKNGNTKTPIPARTISDLKRLSEAGTRFDNSGNN